MVQEEGGQSGAVCGDEGGEEVAVDKSTGWEHLSLIVFIYGWSDCVCFFGVWDSSCVAT